MLFEINETLRLWLLQFSHSKIEHMINSLKELDKAWFPYQYCFIANNNDERTLLEVFKGW
jgi:hypothetical protein